MRLYDYINNNYDRVRRETRIGLMPMSVLGHWRAYSRFDLHVKSGRKICEAITLASVETKLAESTLYLIKKQMEEEI